MTWQTALVRGIVRSGAGTATAGFAIGRAGAGYDRALMLPRLLPLGLSDLPTEEEARAAAICARLERALRRERAKAAGLGRGYDLDRHLALVRALKAERRHLSGLRRGDGPEAEIDAASDPAGRAEGRGRSDIRRTGTRRTG